MAEFDLKEPRVYLFFSADIIGSTRKKQDAQEELCISSWIENVVFNFYNLFVEQFAKEDVNLWKYNGDEILFFAQIFDWNRALCLVKRFRDVIEKNNSLPNSMLVKGTVWTAGFPVRNFILREPVIPNSKIVDFIGPDIDMGFRIAGLASKNRIAISPELALGILSVPDDSNQALKWFFYGRRDLKGIVEDGGIPVVFLSTSNDDCLQDKEDKLMKRDVKCPELKIFLEAFFEQSKIWRERKFFANSDEMKADEDFAPLYDAACAIVDKISGQNNISAGNEPADIGKTLADIKIK